MMSDDQQIMITTDQAYAAMYAFLERFNETYRSDDISNLLHGLSTHSDGCPMDAAHTIDWTECIEKARKGEIDTKIRMTK